MRAWWSFTLFLLASSSLWAQGTAPSVGGDAHSAPVHLFGTVTDSLSGKPVYDCLVEYYGIDGKRHAVSSVNSEGRYALFIPANQAFELRVEKENGYRNLHKAAAPPPDGTLNLRMDLELRPK